ncbi:MAG: DUF4326 domain-containing protein [Candidatus Pacearchaeota archaeon]|nr:DUF4326 domain-containing protein [Clostridia bacterium]
MLFKNSEPTVINLRYSDYDVYIGRGRCLKCGDVGIWGNPYSHKEGTLAKYKVANVDEAIEKYREYLLSNEYLLSQLHTLEGKVLGCWCMPKNPTSGKYYCHGQIIIEEYRAHCM